MGPSLVTTSSSMRSDAHARRYLHLHLDTTLIASEAVSVGRDHALGHTLGGTAA
jgi:hypothetical protein